MLCFAYGSNLHQADLLAWCARRGRPPLTLIPRGPAWWPDMRLVYHYRSRSRQGGALDATPARGAAVSGMLLEMDAAGWATLDLKEGHPAVYRRVGCVVLDAAGDEVEAETYVVTDAHRQPHPVLPTDVYRKAVREGREAFGLPTEMAERLADGAPPPPWPLFVYGTLRAGEAAASSLERFGVRARRDATVAGTLVDLGAYPGLLPGGARRVTGELVTLDDLGGALAWLDEYEDFVGFGRPGSLYRRVLLDVHSASGSTTAWTYRYLGHADGRRRLSVWTRSGR